MSESIGQQLKKERIARYLTLEKASEATRIRTVFLQALEADDYSVMPSAAQGRGFLRNYAEYLELNIDEMLAEIQRNIQSQTAEVSGPLPQVNLVETEIPPLTESADEKPARSFLTSLFGRRPKAESALQETPLKDEAAPIEMDVAELAPQEEVSAVEIEVEQPKPRGRKKKKVEVEIEVEVEAEVDVEIPQPAVVETVGQLAEVTEINAEAPILPIEAEQVEVKSETEPGLLSKFVTMFRSRFVKKELQPDSEIKTEDTPAITEPEVELNAPAQPADVIFAEIGLQLRERRELISLTFDEVERHTKLRTAFVKALEEGAFDKLPSPVQTRGMLANYATFLDLNTDAILLRFADGLQARRFEKYAETPRDKIQTEVVTSMPFLRSFIAGDLIFGVLMIAILAALAIWGVGRVVSSQEEQNAVVTVPAINVLGGTPTPTLDLTSSPAVETPLAALDGTTTVEALPIPGENANVVVSIFAVERAFIRISVDGELIFEGRISPRETKVFEAVDQVVILTGNAAALRVTYNGRDLGLMGGIGEVVNRVYLISGVVTPTATIPPTPTNTLPVTDTATPTGTPTFTPTATAPDGG
jgi:cytoskeletal protein RodZ